MNQQAQEEKPLVLPRLEMVGENAFDGDMFDRSKLALTLTNYVNRLRSGAVIAIDARWGEGKTWFGLNWAKYLKSDGNDHKVIFIDSFAQDYVEDPFLLIAAEIAGLIEADSSSAQPLREKASKVMKAIIPLGAKALLNLAGRVALGSVNLSDDFEEAAKAATEEGADATSKWFENRIATHDEEKQSLENFKIELTKFAALQNKPIVIFIDELDRCRPTFAVQLIERVKHFFDVPNLVFVLLLNREQLENAIRGVYGEKTDATTYLGKFVHLFLSLPKEHSRNRPGYMHRTPAFIQNVLDRYGFSNGQAKLVENFKDDLFQWTIAFNLSLREIERACTLFVLADPQTVGIYTYLIVMKIKYPLLYQRLARNELTAHKELITMMESLIMEKEATSMNWPDIYFKCIQEMHEVQIGTDNALLGTLSKYSREIFGYAGFRKDRTFFEAFNRLDLPVESY